MASMYTNLNINAFNEKQLRQAAVNVGVITPTSNNHGKAASPATIRTAILAK